MESFKNMFSIKGFKLEGFACKSFKMKEGFSRFKDNIKDMGLSVSEFTKSVFKHAKDSYHFFKDDVSKGASSIFKFCGDEAKKLLVKKNIGLEVKSNVSRTVEDSLGLNPKNKIKNPEDKKNGEEYEH